MVNPLISIEQPLTETVQYALLNSNQILERYKHIIDSYVLVSQTLNPIKYTCNMNIFSGLFHLFPLE